MSLIIGCSSSVLGLFYFSTVFRYDFINNVIELPVFGREKQKYNLLVSCKTHVFNIWGNYIINVRISFYL